MPPLSGCVETAAPAAPKEQKPGGGRNLRRKRRAPRPQETPSLPPCALRDAFAGLRPARSVQPHMFHAAPAQRPPSGPQPDEKDFRNSRFSVAALSGTRRHMFPAAFLVQQPLTPPTQRRKQSPLRRKERGPGYGQRPERIAPPCSSRKTPVLRPAQQTTSPCTTPPAQRPLNARLRDGMRAQPRHLASRFTAWKRLKQPGSSRERGPFLQKAGTVLHLFLI